MSEVMMSSKPSNAIDPKVEKQLKPKPIVLEDRNWYKLYCNKCPYFWHEERTEENKDRVMMHCFRPYGEDCLAKSILVSQVIMMDMHNAAMRKMQGKSNHLLSIKHKKIKRRR